MKTILVADDESSIRSLIRRVLESPDCEVLEASGAREALELANKHPDLIVLDRRMPDMDGFEVLQNLRGNDETADIPVIMMSGVEQDDCEGWAASLGVGACLYKPFRPVQLLQKIQELLSRQALVAHRHSRVHLAHRHEPL